jgi:four helix bundle protein
MDKSGNQSFNNKYRQKTKCFAVLLCKILNIPTSSEVKKIIIRQVVRSGTSIAANFYAATRARSSSEYYAKMCIVVEECDESVFWLELLQETNLIVREKVEPILKEANELLFIFSATRKTLRQKRNTS